MCNFKTFATLLAVVLLAACQSGPGAPAAVHVPVSEELAAVNPGVSVQAILRVYENTGVEGTLGSCVAEAFGTQAGSNYSFELPDLDFDDYSLRVYYTGSRNGFTSLLLTAECEDFSHALGASECTGDLGFTALSLLGHQSLFEARTDPDDPASATETFGTQDCQGNVLDDGERPVTSTCMESVFDCDRNGTSNLQEAQDPNGDFFSLGITTRGNGVSDFAQTSADGRFVAFHTTANNFSDDDLNNAEDVYVYDRQTGVLDAVTAGFPGQGGNAPSLQSDIDETGRYVAFASFASNLTEGDTNGFSDIFVRDRNSRRVTLISMGMGGMPADGASFNPSISNTGRFVALESYAENLVAGDSNGVSDVFVADRDVMDDGFFDEPGDTKIVRVSVDSAGTQVAGASRNPSISGSGRFVAFESEASTLVSGDTNGVTDIFVLDRDCDEAMLANPCMDTLGGNQIYDEMGGIRTVRVSVSETGAELAMPSTNPGISQAFGAFDDGRFVVFETLDGSTKTLIPVIEMLGVGNGTSTFNATLGYGPIKPGSVRIQAPMGQCTDDGAGGLIGSGECVGGTVNYGNGDVTVNFNMVQDNMDVIQGDYSIEFSDTNQLPDVYVHDRNCDQASALSGCSMSANDTYDEPGMTRTLLMSHGFDAGTFIASNGASHNPAISGNGNMVVFDSDADNLLPLIGDFNAERDVFARVRGNAGVDEVVGASGVQPLLCRVSENDFEGGNGPSRKPDVSIVGGKVAFETEATNLVTDMETMADTNGKVDIVVSAVEFLATDCLNFVSDSLRATAGRNGGVISQATKDSSDAAISGDGFLASYSSDDTTMITGEFADENGVRDIYLYDPDTARRVERVSLARGRVQVDDAALFPTISGSGQWVAYESDATNIDLTDSGNFSDIFIFDRTVLTSFRASVAIDPITGLVSEANGGSHSPSMNVQPGDPALDGRFVVFESFANNIASRFETIGVGNGATSSFNATVFEKQIVPGTVRVTDGVESCVDDGSGNFGPGCDNGGSGTIVYGTGAVAINFGANTPNGNEVVVSYATTDPDLGSFDIFVLDRDADGDGVFDEDPEFEPGAARISRLSLSAAGGDASGNSFLPRISADGRHVVFLSLADNLVASDTNGVPDIFVVDRDSGADGDFDDGAEFSLVRVSVATDGTESDAEAGSPWISSNGRWVVFDSSATNLVPGDTNGDSDIFLRDRDTDTDGTFDEMGAVSTTRLSLTSTGVEGDSASVQGTISNDGRFVAFLSEATNMVAGDTNGFTDVFVLDRDANENAVFDEVGDYEVRRVNLPPLGRESDDETFAAWMSAGGAGVTLVSDATNLDASDTNNLGDVFTVPNLMAPIAGQGKTLFFNALPPQIPLGIPDQGTIVSTIVVDAAGTLADINVEVEITHDFSGDLSLTLIAPDATEVILSDGNGGDAVDAFESTVFDDEAGLSILDEHPPFLGRFQPEDPLSDLDGASVNGTWTLKITDCCDPDGGMLEFWGIEIETQ